VGQLLRFPFFTSLLLVRFLRRGDGHGAIAGVAPVDANGLDLLDENQILGSAIRTEAAGCRASFRWLAGDRGRHVDTPLGAAGVAAEGLNVWAVRDDQPGRG